MKKTSGLPPGTAAAFRRVRQAEGVSQMELARRADCAQSAISQLEREQRVLTREWLLLLTGALGVSVNRVWAERRKKIPPHHSP